jgi:hypothetical protein
MLQLGDLGDIPGFMQETAMSISLTLQDERRLSFTGLRFYARGAIARADAHQVAHSVGFAQSATIEASMQTAATFSRPPNGHHQIPPVGRPNAHCLA